MSTVFSIVLLAQDCKRRFYLFLYIRIAECHGVKNLRQIGLDRKISQKRVRMTRWYYQPIRRRSAGKTSAWNHKRQRPARLCGSIVCWGGIALTSPYAGQSRHAHLLWQAEYDENGFFSFLRPIGARKYGIKNWRCENLGTL